MITYELSKTLKDVGFSQQGNGFESELLDSAVNSGVNVSRENIYYPTLSELIEACGDKFGFLAKYADGEHWKCSIPGEIFWCNGSTPEEAVAKLWLELNKK